MVAPTRLLTVLAVALSAITALPASADRFEPDPTNCGYTTSHVFHHGNGKSTEVRVTYTSARYTSCDVGKAVARSWATTAGCHDTRYCTVHGNTYSCHNAF